ncbi:UvrD-helicase domain-containing protein [Algoriphagus antarcticus]|nr:UvrD-helicase domain-containing protein [Algoriphagus antarcticus]
MSEEKMMRLGQIARKLNVGTAVIVEKLFSFGYEIENNPNSKINMVQVALLNKEIESSALKREEASHLSIGKRHDAIRPVNEALKGLSVLGKIMLPRDKPISSLTLSNSEAIEVPSGVLKNLFPKEWEELKVGRVKFYDTKKGFGYVYSFVDDKDCFIHASTLLTANISENDIVVFNTTDSKKKRGELDAIKVSNLIPCYLFERNAKGYASPISGFSITQEFPLRKWFKEGIYIIKANESSGQWSVDLINDFSSPEKDKIGWARKVLTHQSQSVTQNRSSIIWLNRFLLACGAKNTDFFRLYKLIFNELNSQGLNEILNQISEFYVFPFLEEYFDDVKNQTFNKVTFCFWIKGVIERLPSEGNSDTIWSEDILPFMSYQDQIEVLNALRIQEGNSSRLSFLINEFLKKPIFLTSMKGVENFKNFINPFLSIFPGLILTEDNFESAYPEVYVALFNSKVISGFSEDKMYWILKDLSIDEDRVRLLEGFPFEKSISYLEGHNSLLPIQQKRIIEKIESEISELDFVCFDLEVDHSGIKEFAWISNSGAKDHSDYNNEEVGLKDLIHLIKSSSLIIGQNIREFDLKRLDGIDVIFFKDFIWDTLEVEMLLNPGRKSYGLMTAHTAAYDTKQTYQLFLNQIARLIASKDLFQLLRPLLPLYAAELIEEKCLLFGLNYVDEEYTEKQSDQYFRPQGSQILSGEIGHALEEVLVNDSKVIVILPELLWDSVSSHYNVNLVSRNRRKSWILSRELVEQDFIKDDFLQIVLLRYIGWNEEKGSIPYLSNLPTAILIKIPDDIIHELCEYSSLEELIEKQQSVAVFFDELLLIDETQVVLEGYQAVVLCKELSQLTTKIQLGQDLDFATIFEKFPKQEPIWLKLSGGQSYVSLESRHLELLHIDFVPKYVKNIWIDKTGRSQFKVFCNQDIDGIIGSLSFENIISIEFKERKSNKTNGFVIKPDSRKSGFLADAHRVNAESFYRDKYWVYQFKLLQGIRNIKEDHPKVLIVNDTSEVDLLSSYSRAIGFFVPDNRSSTIRQLELLHAYSSQKKLMVIPIAKLIDFISINYVGPIDFIWDSFLLQEKSQMIKFEVLEKDESEVEGHSNEARTGMVDTFTLLKSHKALIDFYYYSIIDNHAKSNFFLGDSRLSDYYDVARSFQMHSSLIEVWSSEEKYKSDHELVRKFFPSNTPSSEIPFGIDEAKDLLRYIFLADENPEKPHEWRDYQHLYLDEILQAKKDLIVSLPTGAGKSVLFQAPALFRSGFTNKLTIVIVPLRALMQDQVDGLWDKGFFSNVDFISGDKSPVEIKDIYRRISGGEITMLFITPERFRVRSFENALLSRVISDNGLEFAVFDEAHCISQWGLDFRPDYMNAAKKVTEYSSKFQLKKLLFSATISEQVAKDITRIMGNLDVVEGAPKNYNPVRDHIRMDFKHNVAEEDRLTEIANYLKIGNFDSRKSRAIIFVKSRKKVEESALLFPDYLKEEFGDNCGLKDKVGFFHAGMDAEDRRETYDKYKSGELVILFSTKAFGMGMDIPNIHYVAHLSPSSTFEDFLQEVGRAGRNERLRYEAGFYDENNSIKTLCLTSNDDFAQLKDQLLESRISWHEVKEAKGIVEKYIQKFKPLIPDLEHPTAIPLDLLSIERGKTDESLNINFRLALHWLEKLERIKLGYSTVTHLELFKESIIDLQDNLGQCQDEDSLQVCRAIVKLQQIMPDQHGDEDPELIQLSLTALRDETKLSLSNLYKSLYKAHSINLIKINQHVLIETTRLRADEIKHALETKNQNEKFPAIKAIFSFARSILKSVPLSDSKTFEGDELDYMLNEAISEEVEFNILPWTTKDKTDSKTKELQNFKKDLIKKRAKHAFTIIRILGKTRHESKMEKKSDGSRKAIVHQSVFNGYHKIEEWSTKLLQLENDVTRLLLHISNSSIKKNEKSFNWADLINDVNLKEDVNYLQDLLFILSILGYCKSGGIFPSGIELYLKSIEAVVETDLQSDDKKVFEEFEEARKVRELKLIALEVLANYQKGKDLHDAALRFKQETFIKKYFACDSLESLLDAIQQELDPEDPLLVKWRGDAIQIEEDKLNDEQRNIYDTAINQHINVMAGPGSGKTHTLTLRVAKLVHHVGINPDEILVLAYNRAVVSELKDRLGKLFNELGYGRLSKRLKIFTFHGLAKKYCLNKLEGRDFNEWEPILLDTLRHSPGEIFNQLGSLKHILVDEFQDINNTRVQLLSELQKSTNSSLFIIGDPNQSIYGYDRKADGGSLSPWPYYDNFNQIFSPAIFKLYKNHRSYPNILSVASDLLTLPADQQDLIPIATRVPSEDFREDYVQVFDNLTDNETWWGHLKLLLDERNNKKPYKQIAILFRKNDEVYRGFQRLKSMRISEARIRLQGALPCEFFRIRECYEVMLFVKSKQDELVRSKFELEINKEVLRLITAFPKWNHFYLRVFQSLILEFLSEEENITYSGLLDFLIEMCRKDDGQLYKIYEKYKPRFSNDSDEIEIVLSTIHKVKGLEFDCVIVPPSFSSLPLKETLLLEEDELLEIFEEEKRVTYVAYTRARYRLLVFKGMREHRLIKNEKYTLPNSLEKRMGIGAGKGLDKLILSWAAKEDNYRGKSINLIIKNHISSGDSVFVQKRVSGQYTFYELHHEKLNKIVGSISSSASRIREFNRVSGFVVNEVVVWTYEDSLRSDERNGTSFSTQWCEEAKAIGYVYLVDFAGYGETS